MVGTSHSEQVPQETASAAQALLRRVDESPQREASRLPVADRWLPVTWAQLGNGIHRIAACLILHYDQPVTRITNLTTEHVQHGDDSVVRLRLSEADLTMLPELAACSPNCPANHPVAPPGASLTGPLRRLISAVTAPARTARDEFARFEYGPPPI